MLVVRNLHFSSKLAMKVLLTTLVKHSSFIKLALCMNLFGEVLDLYQLPHERNFEYLEKMALLERAFRLGNFSGSCCISPCTEISNIHLFFGWWPYLYEWLARTWKPKPFRSFESLLWTNMSAKMYSWIMYCSWHLCMWNWMVSIHVDQVL